MAPSKRGGVLLVGETSGDLDELCSVAGPENVILWTPRGGLEVVSAAALEWLADSAPASGHKPAEPAARRRA